jgi:cytochrome c
MRRRIAAITLTCAVLGTASWGVESATTRTVWDGIYTEAQAQRGEKVLLAQCSMCHGESMHGGGGVPSATGPEFLFNWLGKPVGELFAYLKRLMPPTAPGSLSNQQYVDAMAALFKRDGFPAGSSTEIPENAEALSDVVITDEKP